MPMFQATVRVVHVETWTVEADDEAHARRAISELSEDVETDETGGEVVDWEVNSIGAVCTDCGQAIKSVPNSGDQGRCGPCRAQHG